jgi:hypothetical protein
MPLKPLAHCILWRACRLIAVSLWTAESGLNTSRHEMTPDERRIPRKKVFLDLKDREIPDLSIYERVLPILAKRSGSSGTELSAAIFPQLVLMVLLSFSSTSSS